MTFRDVRGRGAMIAVEIVGPDGHSPDPVRTGTDDAFDSAYAELERRITELAPRLTAP